nr:MAG TPA: antitoxin [Caudoviricetes sp.]
MSQIKPIQQNESVKIELDEKTRKFIEELLREWGLDPLSPEFKYTLYPFEKDES